VAIHAQAYQRSLLEPFPVEQTSRPRLCLASRLTASPKVSFVPGASVSVKFDAITPQRLGQPRVPRRTPAAGCSRRRPSSHQICAPQ
jgi:hypothetical protein